MKPFQDIFNMAIAIWVKERSSNRHAAELSLEEAFGRSRRAVIKIQKWVSRSVLSVVVSFTCSFNIFFCLFYFRLIYYCSSNPITNKSKQTLYCKGALIKLLLENVENLWFWVIKVSTSSEYVVFELSMNDQIIFQLCCERAMFTVVYLYILEPVVNVGMNF